MNHDGLQAQDGQPKLRVPSSPQGHCSLTELHCFSLRQVDSNVILKEEFIFHLFGIFEVQRKNTGNEKNPAGNGSLEFFGSPDLLRE